jgi:hypothetical protein
MVRDLITIIDTCEKGFDYNDRDREQILFLGSDIKLTQTGTTEIEYFPAESCTKLSPSFKHCANGEVAYAGVEVKPHVFVICAEVKWSVAASSEKTV